MGNISFVYFPPYYQVVRIGINLVDSMGSKLTLLFDTTLFSLIPL